MAIESVERNAEANKDAKDLPLWEKVRDALLEALATPNADHSLALHRDGSLTDAEWQLERIRFGLGALRDCIEVNANKRGGVPVLKGTRFTLAQLFAEMADGRSIGEIAEDFDLDFGQLKQFLEGVAIQLDRSFIK
jgi:uncharacterized protein (DUF433 family)